MVDDEEESRQFADTSDRADMEYSSGYPWPLKLLDCRFYGKVSGREV